MRHVDQKAVSCINWRGVSPLWEEISEGMRWSWSGSSAHTIIVTHSDGTTQGIIGHGEIVVTRYDGSVYEFYGA